MAEKIEKYAKTVINQADQQHAKTRNNWINPANAQNYVPTTYATSHYTKEGTTYKKPHILYAYDFEVINELPYNAVITGLKFEVRMRHTSKLNVKAPMGLFNSTVGGVFQSDGSGGNPKKTGVYNGVYQYYPDENISNSWKTVEYKISKANLAKYKDAYTSFTQQGFGLQLVFQDAKSTGSVYVEWIKVTLEYEVPDRYVEFQTVSRDETEPTDVLIDNEVTFKIVTGNKSSAPEVNTDRELINRTFNVDFPLGFEVVSVVPSGDTISYSDGEWTVSGKGKSQAELTVKAIPRASGLKELRVFDITRVGSYNAYFYVDSTRNVGYDEIVLTPINMRRGETSCMEVSTYSQSSTTSYSLGVTVPQLVAADVVNVSLNEQATTYGVELNDYSVSNNTVALDLTVPANTEFLLQTTICFIPRVDGTQTITVTTPRTSKTFDVEIADPYEKHLIFNTDEDGSCTQKFKLSTSRFITQVEGDLVVLPIRTDTYDSDMYVDESTFGLRQWNKVRYIGPVEVPYAHYDPKHTTKDKLLYEHYKNNEFFGKENAPDETITLKIKVPRRKTPTIIGLTKIDKPIPINLVPNAFENDPLNHRGWAEIYGVEVDPTNPLYDSLDIDVKYITHNIISRFTIKALTSDRKFSLPNVFNNSLDSGSDLGEFFDVETDGSYIYDETEETFTHRNLFSINNQQDILLRSKEVLAAKSQFEFYWDTTLFSEIRENNIQRFIRLVDDKDNVVFEYEYCDFDFSESVYSCTAMGRALTDQGYDLVINRPIYIHSDVEHTEDEQDEDYDDEDIDIYGSSVLFELDNNVLTVKERGFTGYEFEQTVTLLTGSYHLEVYWKNLNNDADTGNIVSYMDCTVGELTYDNVLAQYYNKILVSPYPVPYKKIVYTRECEEGTLYYLQNDDKPFDFLLEPYYQYKCGVDLVAEDSSIFDFNNSYPVIYVQNGLVRFGINRLNGDLYLDKWDYSSKTYVRTNRFRIDKFDDAEVTKLDDDVIVVNVSDINITVWRGRPYVMLEHPNEDINILNTFNQVFADGVNSDPLDYPILYSLYNSQNLLPECIGGTLLKSSCITVEEDDTPLDDIGEFTITPNKNSYIIGEEIICTLPQITGTFALVVNGDVVEQTTDTTITTTANAEGVLEIYAVYLGTDTTAMKLSNKLTLPVENIIVDPYDQGTSEGYKLVCTTNATKLKYNQGTVDFKLTCDGVPVTDIEIQVYNPHQTWHIDTDNNGEVKSANNKVPAGTHKWIATAWDDGILLGKRTKTITIVESTPKIIGTTLSFKAGKKAVFKITDESGTPLTNTNLEITLGGKKYVRKTNNDGEASLKVSKKATYTNVKVKYAGEKKKYNSVTKTFTVVVK